MFDKGEKDKARKKKRDSERRKRKSKNADLEEIQRKKKEEQQKFEEILSRHRPKSRSSYRAPQKKKFKFKKFKPI